MSYKFLLFYSRKFQIVPDIEPNVSLEILVNDISKLTIAALLEEIDSQIGYATLFQEKLRKLFTLENQEVKNIKQLFSSEDVILVGTAKEKIADATLQAIKQIIAGETATLVKKTQGQDKRLSSSNKNDSGFSDYDLNSDSGVQKLSRRSRDSLDANIEESPILMREEQVLTRSNKYLKQPGPRSKSEQRRGSNDLALIPFWLKDKIDVTMNAILNNPSKDWLMNKMADDGKYLQGRLDPRFDQRIRKCEECERERRNQELQLGIRGRGRLVNHSIILQQADKKKNSDSDQKPGLITSPRFEQLQRDAEIQERKRRKAEREKMLLDKRRQMHYTAAQQMKQRNKLPSTDSKMHLSAADGELRLAQESEKRRQKEEKDALQARNRMIKAEDEAERRKRQKEQTEMIRKQAEDEERQRMKDKRRQELEERKRLAKLDEEAERRRKEREAELERERLAEEARRKAEEDAARAAEEARKAAEAEEARKKAEAEAAAAAREQAEREREKSREMGVIQPMHQEEEVKRKFKIKQKIGEGAFATVYAAELIDGEPPGLADPDCRDYALKVMDKTKIQSNLDNVKEEIKLHSKCDHPNIARLYDVYETPSRIYMVMEEVPGGDLFDAIAESVKFDESQTALIIRSLAEALVYLHSKGSTKNYY